MKLKIVAPLCALALAVVVSGCVTSVDGRQHAGVPFVKDKLESRYERSPMEIWQRPRTC